MTTRKASTRAVLRRPAKARTNTRGSATQDTSEEDVTSLGRVVERKRRPQPTVLVEETMDCREEEIVHRRPASSDAVSNRSPPRNIVGRDPCAQRRLSLAQRQHIKRFSTGRVRPMPKQSAFPAGRSGGGGKVPVDSAGLLAQSDPDVRGSVEPEAFRRPPRQQRTGDWRKEGRLAYSAADDEAMRRFVVAHSQLKPKGAQLWKDAEAAGITGHGWASMQNRWRRKLSRTSRAQDGASESVNRRRQPNIRQALQAATTNAVESSRHTATSQSAPVSETRAETRASPKSALAPRRREVASATVDRHDGFDGQWFCGDQAHVVKDGSVILDSSEGSRGSDVCELRRSGDKACQFVLTSNESSTLNGKLSADGQQIVWEDGCIWSRTQGSRQVEPTKETDQDLTASIGECAPILTSFEELYSREKVGRYCDDSIRTRSPRRQRQAVVVNEDTMRQTSGIFYEGICPSKISGVDVWKDKMWDEIAEKVGNHFDEPRIHSHWVNFMERLNCPAGFDESRRSTTA